MAPISETILTRKSGPARVIVAMTPLAQLLEARIKEIEGAEGIELSVAKIAQRCGVPPWIVRDALSGQSKRPRPEHLSAMARGLGLDETAVILAANQPNGNSPNGGDPRPTVASVSGKP